MQNDIGIDFIPLAGIDEDSSLAYLLDIQTAKLLLDCGWSDEFNLKQLQPIFANFNKTPIQYILISFPDFAHCGALPSLFKYLKTNKLQFPKILINSAAASLLFLTLYETFLNFASTADPPFDLDDIDFLKSHISEVGYGQPFFIADSEVVCFRAGRVLGGSIWRIKKDPEVIVYAVDFNHKNEIHLEAADFPQRPSILITDTYNFNVTQLSRPKREEAIVNSILSRLRFGGSVLVPINPLRAIELILLLERVNLSYPVYFYSPVVNSLMRTYETNSEQRNIWNFKHIHFVSTLDTTDKQPKVILCSSETLNIGLVRNLFVEFASDRKNLILFLDKTFSKVCLARKLVDLLIQQVVIFPEVHFKLLSWKYQSEAEITEWKEKLIAKKRKEEQEAQRQILEQELFDKVDIHSSSFKARGLFEVFTERSNASGNTFSFIDPFKNMSLSNYGILPPKFKKSNKSSRSAAPTKLKEAGEDDLIMGVKGDAVKDATLPKNLRAQLPRAQIVEEKLVKIKCGIQYVDFEGRSDSRSVKYTIEKLAPRRLILVHGSLKSCEELKTDVSNLFATSHSIVIPKLGQRVDICSSVGLWKVKLDKGLSKPESNPLFVDHAKIGSDIEITYLEGKVVKDEQDVFISYDSESQEEEQKLDTGDDFWTTMRKRKRARYSTTRTEPEQLITTQKYSLISLEDKLKETGMKVGFKQAVLFGETMFLKKSENRLELSSAFTPEFFKAKKALNAQFIKV